MNLNEVVGEVAKCSRGDVVLDLLRERIRKSSEPANCHPNRQVMSLDIARVNVLRVRLSNDGVALAPDALGGAVALLSIVRDTVDLHQHRIVYVAAKCFIHRLDVKLQAIASKLDAIGQATRKVFNEVPSGFWGPLPDVPARYQLGISVNCGPEPRIARAGVIVRDGRSNILRLRVDERPAFINLHPFAPQGAKHAILVVGTERAKFDNQPKDGFFRHASYADGGADGIAFDQAANDGGALLGGEAVHTSIMREPPTHVKTFEKIDQNSLGGTARFGAVRPSRFSGKGSGFAALFGGHASGPSCPATRPAAPTQFGHDAGNLGRPWPFHLWLGKHFDLMVGKLVKVWFRFTARAFRIRHTLLVSHGCVGGSSVQNFKCQASLEMSPSLPR
jgi:hypothetical protein